MLFFAELKTNLSGGVSSVGYGALKSFHFSKAKTYVTISTFIPVLTTFS